MKKSLTVLMAAIFLFTLTGCSSAPKRTMQINTVYKNVTTTLETANTAMINGNYAQAENLLGAAYKSSMSIDNYDLLTTVCLSYVSLYLSYEEPAVQMAQVYMDEAFYCAGYSFNETRNLALCTLSNVRLQIAQGKTDYNEYIAQLNKAKGSTKLDVYNLGLFSSVEGDVYLHKQDYKNAEQSYLDAAAVFTKNRYLGEIGITWYKLAQVRSLAGNKKSALEAINNAIKYDRDSENSIALGTDYYAMGLILTKGTSTAAEIARAKYAFEHSAQIFSSIGMKDMSGRSQAAFQTAELKTQN